MSETKNATTRQGFSELFEHARKEPAYWEMGCRLLERELAQAANEIEALTARVRELESALQNQRGDDVCWIRELGQAKALPESEFLESCRRYRAQIASERGEFTSGRTIAQLEKRIAALEQDRERFFKLLDAADQMSLKLQVIHDDPMYKYVWTSAAIHGIDYTNGPKYEQELTQLRTAIDAARKKEGA